MEILKDLFDEKIIKIIDIFLENPTKRFNLTEIANKSRINVATTSRILTKLIEKRFIKETIIGKIRIYQWARNEKTLALTKLLKKDNSPLQDFINEVSLHPRIKKIILESKQKENAKLLIVGSFIPTEKINKLCKKIKNKEKFTIHFVEISESQYENLKNFKTYDLENKIIWKREE